MKKNTAIKKAKELYKQTAQSYADILKQQMIEQDKERAWVDDEFQCFFREGKDRICICYRHPEYGGMLGYLHLEEARDAVESEYNYIDVCEYLFDRKGCRSLGEYVFKKHEPEEYNRLHGIEGITRDLYGELVNVLVRNKALMEFVYGAVSLAKRIDSNLRGMEILVQERDEIRAAQEGESYAEEKKLKDEQDS